MDKSHLQQLGLQCRRVLIDQPHYRLSVNKFQILFAQFYHKTCNLEELKMELSNIVRVRNLSY